MRTFHLAIRNFSICEFLLSFVINSIDEIGMFSELADLLSFSIEIR